MNRFLVIGFELGESFHYALILCMQNLGGTEYRISVMNGDIEKLLCDNKTLREENGCLHMQPSRNGIEHRIVTEIGKALGKVIGLPLRETKAPDEVS